MRSVCHRDIVVAQRVLLGLRGDILTQQENALADEAITKKNPSYLLFFHILLKAFSKSRNGGRGWRLRCWRWRPWPTLALVVVAGAGAGAGAAGSGAGVGWRWCSGVDGRWRVRMALAEVAGAGGRGAGGGWLSLGALLRRRRVGPASESALGRPRLPGHNRGPTHPVTVAPPRHRVHSRGSCGPRSLWTRATGCA